MERGLAVLQELAEGSLAGVEPEAVDDVDDHATLVRWRGGRNEARAARQVRFRESIDPQEERWTRCSRVLAQIDIVDRLSAPW